MEKILDSHFSHQASLGILSARPREICLQHSVSYDCYILVPWKLCLHIGVCISGNISYHFYYLCRKINFVPHADTFRYFYQNNNS